jgi:hypothetical protein
MQGGYMENNYELISSDDDQYIDLDNLKQRRQLYQRIGWWLTATSMIGQSIFGMLLIDRKAMKNSNLGLRVAVDLALLITAFEGKRRLVQYFSSDNFKKIADKDFLTNVRRSTCTPDGIVNMLFTVNASLVFAGLSNVGFDGAATLLLEFDNDFSTMLAHGLKSGFVKYPVALTALISNLFSFPHLHRGAVFYLRDLVKKVRLLCSQSQTDAAEERVMKIVRLKNHLINSGAGKQSLDGSESTYVKQFFTLVSSQERSRSTMSVGDRITELNDTADLRLLTEKMLDEYDKNIDSILPLNNDPYRGFSPAERASGILLNGLGFVLTGYGFYNFKNMPSAILHQQTGLTETLGWTMFASMMCIALVTVPSAVSQAMNLYWPRSVQLPVLSPCAKKSVLIGAVFFCLIGASPNAYQAAVLDPVKEPPEYVAAAFLAPVIVELFTFVSLFTSDILFFCKRRTDNQIVMHELFDTLFDNIIDEAKRLDHGSPNAVTPTPIV